MVGIEEWWPKLGNGTREWLLAHAGEPLPPDVMQDVAQARGGIASDAWWVGNGGPSGFYISDDAVDWIEEEANGEHPA